MRHDAGFGLIQKSRPTGIISEQYQNKPELLQQLRTSFRDNGYVKLPEFLTPDTFRAVSSEVTRLNSARVRKDFVMPDFNTDRKMSVLSGKDVVRQSEVIANIYASQKLRGWITSLISTDIHTVLHDDEFLVVNFLDGERDTHGWHLDDPRYALIIVVESPETHIGGCIEYIPEWKRLALEEGFEPHQNVERGVEICKRKGKLRSDTLKSSDCYLLDAGEVLHRVSPMSADGSRKALNLAFDDRRYRVYGETATRLYA
jgi:hypothetical protein